MKIPAAMLELFLKSYGAPPDAIELFKLIQAEGFSAFAFKPVSADDPNWTAIEADPTRKQTGVWLRAEGSTSRVTAVFLFEGVNDEALKIFSRGGITPALPAQTIS